MTAAAAVLFGGLAAVGVTAGAALTAGPPSPSLPPALAPATRASTTPASSLTITLTYGNGVIAAAARPRARAGRPARGGAPPGHPPAGGHRLRRAHAGSGRLGHVRPERRRLGHGPVNAAPGDRGHAPETREAPLAR